MKQEPKSSKIQINLVYWYPEKENTTLHSFIENEVEYLKKFLPQILRSLYQIPSMLNRFSDVILESVFRQSFENIAGEKRIFVFHLNIWDRHTFHLSIDEDEYSIASTDLNLSDFPLFPNT